MRESNYTEAALSPAHTEMPAAFPHGQVALVPFFSMRKLRIVFNELRGQTDFEFSDFDAFKHHVLSSAAPQLELSKWQAIASRR
jgi:hypothetical protein